MQIQSLQERKGGFSSARSSRKLLRAAVEDVVSMMCYVNDNVSWSAIPLYILIVDEVTCYPVT